MSDDDVVQMTPVELMIAREIAGRMFDAELPESAEGPLPAPDDWRPETPVEMLAQTVLDEHRNPASRLSTLWLDIVQECVLRRYVAPVNETAAAQSVYTLDEADLPGDLVCQLFFGYSGTAHVSFADSYGKPRTIGRVSIGADGAIRDAGDCGPTDAETDRLYNLATRCLEREMATAVPLYFATAQLFAAHTSERPLRCATAWCDAKRGDVYDSTQTPWYGEDVQMGRMHLVGAPLAPRHRVTYITMDSLLPHTPRVFGLDNHCNIAVCGTFKTPGEPGCANGVCVLDRETRRVTHYWTHPMVDPAQCHMEFTLRENHLILTLPEDDGSARHHVGVFTRCGHLVRILATFHGVISFMCVHPVTGNLWVGIRRAPTATQRPVHEVVELLAIE